ncbi:MAG: Gfo/Idh/MocA family oxidoreductase [Clostridia bacterium]|nr:Gfo/Idh/MocA family oxidoreductase [Clostridia bacterium]
MQTGRESAVIRVVIVGAGHRSLLYASYALENPDKMKVVGVVDPNEIRRKHVAERFDLPEQACFCSVEELVRGPKIADAVINGTMDKVHIPTSLPLLQAGYDILLEKPIGVAKAEVLGLLATARQYGRKVLICHVLRYAPFYVEIKKQLLSGAIGDILTLNTEENVSYHHMAVSFVRGKWSRLESGGSSFLMAKSCHDLDLITWLKSGVRPVKVSSFGQRSFFRPDRAPSGSGLRCLVDCTIEKDCPYSAYKNYIEQDLWRFYAWEGIEHISLNPTVEQKIESQKTDNPHGRCVWNCDNTVADHQMVMVEFEDGSTAVHHLNSAAAKGCRTIHVIGSKGELVGNMEDGTIEIRTPDARKDHIYASEIIQIDVMGDMHGGGDLRLVDDFVKVLQGQAPSISSTTIEDSIYGHLIGFSADESVRSEKVLALEMI